MPLSRRTRRRISKTLIVESTRGLAVLDFNRDGRTDLLLTNVDAPPNLLLSEGGDNAWVAFRLEGRRSNRDAIGARLMVETGGRTLVRDVNPFGSFQSQSSYEVHFGLGRAERVERLTVRWPNGETEQIADLAARRFYTVTEGQGVTATTEPASR